MCFKFWSRRRRTLIDRRAVTPTDDSNGVEVKRELREALHEQATRVHWLEWEAERMRMLGWQADVESRGHFHPPNPREES